MLQLTQAAQLPGKTLKNKGALTLEERGTQHLQLPFP